MPFISEAQRRWAHTDEGTKALGGEEKVKEWEEKTPEDISEKKENNNKDNKEVKETKENKEEKENVSKS